MPCRRAARDADPDAAVTPGRLIVIRRQLGLTQAELGLRLGYSPRTAYFWESGARTIPWLVGAVLEGCLVDEGLLEQLGVWGGLEAVQVGSAGIPDEVAQTRKT